MTDRQESGRQVVILTEDERHLLSTRYRRLESKSSMATIARRFPSSLGRPATQKGRNQASDGKSLDASQCRAAYSIRADSAEGMPP